MRSGIPHGWRTDGDDEVELLVIFALTPDSDYEEMFRVVSGTPVEDWETRRRALATNRMDVPVPPVFV
jgi:hypothetical protein